MHGSEGDMVVHCNLFEISTLKCLKKKKVDTCVTQLKKGSGK